MCHRAWKNMFVLEKNCELQAVGKLDLKDKNLQ